MAAPVVAAMAALLRSEFVDPEMYPTKFIYGQLSSTSGHSGTCLDVQTHGVHNLPAVANLYTALTSMPQPQVGVSDYYAFDTAETDYDTFMASLCVNGTMNLNGTREDPILIYPSDLMSEYAIQFYTRNGGELNMAWTDVTNLAMYYNEGGMYSVTDGYISNADHCTFRMNYGDGYIRYRNLGDGSVRDQMSNSGMMTIFKNATNCVFYKISLLYRLTLRGEFDTCIFADCALEYSQYDFADFPAAYGLLNYKPFLETAPENVFPFVTGFSIFNKAGEKVTTVANEEITVRITFNRDMDTSIPLSVQYGSASPYRDYTIEGAYIDARTWEGKKLLTTVIENGTQYFVIENGWSAEGDLMLCTDSARFAFELDTTAAQALIMQGEATAEGIRLSWALDTMAPNIYHTPVYTATPGLVRLTCATPQDIWCCDMLELTLEAREGAMGTTPITAEIRDVSDSSRFPYRPGSAEGAVTVIPKEVIRTPKLILAGEDPIIGESTAMTLILEEGSGLAAADFELTFDPKLVECIDIQPAGDSSDASPAARSRSWILCLPWATATANPPLFGPGTMDPAPPTGSAPGTRATSGR